MGAESSSEYFNIAGTIQSTNTSRYLSVGDDSTSYKTLTFANTTGGGGGSGATNVWALEGDTIITGQSSSWGRRKSSREQSRGLQSRALLNWMQNSISSSANWMGTSGRSTSRPEARRRAARRAAIINRCICLACAEMEQ